jgi:predicted acylesterase/phospholipase RssA
MQYDLVFEGGGAKGMALVGAYEELAGQGHSFGRLLGTSAGAITAVFLAAGYSSDEMVAVLTEQDAAGHPVFASFMGEPPPFTGQEIEHGAFRRLLGGVDLTFIPGFVEDPLKDQLAGAIARTRLTRNFLALVERGGWYSAHNFLTWLRAKLDAGEVDGKPRNFSAMTLAEFYAATGVDVTFCATDTTGGRQLVLNHRTAPHCPLVYAVRMSMSIPLLWDEVIWDAAWGPYQGRDITGHTIVDGGVLSNFPLELFVSDAPFVTAVMGPKQNNPVLGLLLDDGAPVPQPRGLLVRVTIKPTDLATVQRLRGLVDTMLGARDKQVMESFADLVVALPAGGYGTTEFDMSEPKRNALLEAARNAMRTYLAAHPPLPPSAGLAAPPSPAVQNLADNLAARLLAP